MFRRFLPYLWPAGARDPSPRRLVAGADPDRQGDDAADAVRLQGGDRPDGAGAGTRRVPGRQPGRRLCGRANFGGVFFDNVRNTIFERVGQDATQRLATHVFRHLHDLSLRFHLSRRTGAVTKVIERGTKSIDVMLYFLLFNIGPT